MAKKFKIAFDFVCDEAPLFGNVGQIFAKDGWIIMGLTLGCRWKEYWADFKTYPILKERKNFNVKDELFRIQQLYGEFYPASFPTADRFISSFSREQQMKILINTFYFVELFFDNEKPDAYICTGIAYLYNLVTFCVCKKRGIPHISIYSTRGAIPRFTYSLGINGRWDYVTDKYRELLSLDREKFNNVIENINNRVKESNDQFRPFYMRVKRQSINLEPVFIREFCIRLFRYYIKKWGFEKEDYVTKHPLWYVKRDLCKLLRAKLFQIFRKNIFDSFSFKNKYYLFPIHLQPEASTLIHAQWYVNQIEAINNIAKCIPVDSCLYVKEHISSFGRHDLNFYSKIKAIHNVKLIGPFENTKELIENSQGVITLTSTMGWESILLSKPTYVLGEVFYLDLYSDLKIKNFYELKEKVMECSNVISEKEVVAFRCAIEEASFPGLFDVVKMDVASIVLGDENVINVSLGIQSIVKNVLSQA